MPNLNNIKLNRMKYNNFIYEWNKLKLEMLEFSQLTSFWLLISHLSLWLLLCCQLCFRTQQGFNTLSNRCRRRCKKKHDIQLHSADIRDIEMKWVVLTNYGIELKINPWNQLTGMFSIIGAYASDSDDDDKSPEPAGNKTPNDLTKLVQQTSVGKLS